MLERRLQEAGLSLCPRKAKCLIEGARGGFHDRSSFRADAQRLEDIHHARRMRAALRCGAPSTSRAGDQFKPEFRPTSIPTGGFPSSSIAIRPTAPIPCRSSNPEAILLYLAEKTGRLFPRDLRARYRVQQWLMWQMSGLGPMLGQNGHFSLYAPEKIPYAIERYRDEARRLYGVLDDRLRESGAYVAGDEYSIADIACFPWVMTHKAQGFHAGRVRERQSAGLPSCARGRSFRKAWQSAGATLARFLDDRARANLFGTKPAAVERSVGSLNSQPLED